MYVPYWLYTFDGDAEIRVIAKRRRTWITADVEYTEISRYQIDEGAHGEFRNIPADALKEMDNTLMDSIEPFDFSRMKNFNPAYLAGFYTQKWDEDAAKNEPRAKIRAKESLTKAALDHVGTYNGGTEIQSEQFTWSHNAVHYAMLPVWMMYTEYKGKKYHHILDTDSGYPVDTDVVGVSIKGPAGHSADCDGLSTTCLILGLKEGKALVEGMEGYEALFILADDSIEKTDGFEFESE
jgi:hypothetical protein